MGFRCSGASAIRTYPLVYSILFVSALVFTFVLHRSGLQALRMGGRGGASFPSSPFPVACLLGGWFSSFTVPCPTRTLSAALWLHHGLALHWAAMILVAPLATAATSGSLLRWPLRRFSRLPSRLGVWGRGSHVVFGPVAPSLSTLASANIVTFEVRWLGPKRIAAGLRIRHLSAAVRRCDCHLVGLVG